MSPRACRTHSFEFRIARAVGVLLCLLFATACDEQNPIDPPVPLDRPFVLAPGEVASIEGTALRVRFEEVASDSRCPIDVFCVQAGEAVVVIRVFDESGSSRYELHTSDRDRRQTTHRNLTIEVIELQPHPSSGRRTDPSEYRATFKTTRAA